jgi:hypothetical protein
MRLADDGVISFVLPKISELPLLRQNPKISAVEILYIVCGNDRYIETQQFTAIIKEKWFNPR